jgi:thiamine biosynthesis lipoprotein
MKPRAISRRELFRLEREPPAADHWIRVHRFAMACRFEITLSGEDAALVPAARDVLADLERIEAALTVFRDSSTISRLNRDAAQGPVVVEPDVFELLALCRTLHADTDGAFDVTSTPLSRCWGFLRRAGRLPAAAEIEAALSCVGMDAVALDASTSSVHFRRAGSELNLGGIGKGYALGVMAAGLRARGAGRALLSAAGSSVLALGGPPGGWPIEVRSRQGQGRTLARLFLEDGAMGTTGAGEQFLEVDGRRYGHVLDPRSGWPAEGMLSVTVVCADPACADALSTAFFVGGLDLATRYCASHPETLALLATSDGQLHLRGTRTGARLETTS